ncbi:hypothetical protein XENOCAPTIV_009065 [Xenoophorus captivus]|uniref:Uncharacterized protein n=1 Tax=Xenoophorus captivus TaxID=1517983 RepID=A0ABV0RC00_9TELE
MGSQYKGVLQRGAMKRNFISTWYLLPQLWTASNQPGGLWEMRSGIKQGFFTGSSNLPVHGLLLFPSVPHPSNSHANDGDPEEHHFRGNMLRRKAQLRGTVGKNTGVKCTIYIQIRINLINTCLDAVVIYLYSTIS